MSRYIVDRLEGDYAVLEHEDLTFSSVRRDHLPHDVKAGDCLVQDDAGWHIDAERTAERRAIIAEKMQNLFR